MEIFAKILLVEDVEDHAFLLNHFLKKRGCELKWVKDAHEAIQHLDRGCFDLLILDLMLAEESGIEVLRHIKSHHIRNRVNLSELPVLITTANYGWQHKITGLDLPYSGFLEKPFTPHDLLSEINKVVSARHTNERNCI